MSRPHPPLAPDPGARVATVPGRRHARTIRLAVLGMAALLAAIAGYAWQQRDARDAAPDAHPAAPPGPAGTGVVAPAPPAAAADPVRAPALLAAPSAHAPAGVIALDGDGLDDAPPATVDSPQARQAWLQRIRELRDAGALGPARESLLEYRRRYPGLDVPEDLEGLLSE